MPRHRIRRLKKGEAVTYELAKERILCGLSRKYPQKPGHIGLTLVWPGSEMRPQGAAFAMAPILHRMHEEGLIRWTVEHDGEGKPKNWGWINLDPMGICPMCLTIYDERSRIIEPIYTCIECGEQGYDCCVAGNGVVCTNCEGNDDAND